MLRHGLSVESFIARHSGVQFSDDNEDIVLAAILSHLYLFPHIQDVTTIWCNEERVIEDLLNNEYPKQSFSHTDGLSFSETQDEVVELHCLCCSPWIEGSTSKAIYGEKQKMFNTHSCSIFRNWFHNTACEKVPKRNHDFVCPECTLPATIPWYNEIYKNTCTSEILSILLLYFHQHPELISAISSSPSELSLKAGIKMMLEGNLDQGKVVILDFVRSQLNFTMQKGIHDCLGSER